MERSPVNRNPSVRPPQHVHADRAAGTLTLTWRTDHIGVYPLRYLRLNCHCASCVDEWTGKPLLNPDSVPHDIGVVGLEPVGNYALRIRFSDGHDTGLFTWERLANLCPCPACQTRQK